MRWKGASRGLFSLLLLAGCGVGWLRGQNPPAADFRVLFPHFAAGQGFATVFTLMNSGQTTAEGVLTLHNADGSPHTLVEISVPPQGVSSYLVRHGLGVPLRAGWAEYEGSGGTVTGVATFQLTGSNAKLRSIAGVMSSPLVQSIMIPVETEIGANTYSGYAIANPGDTMLTVTVSAFDQDGTPLGEISRLTLQPRQQVARYVHADMPGVDYFTGSLVISTQDSPFIAVSLAEKDGLYTAVPAVSRPVR